MPFEALCPYNGKNLKNESGFTPFTNQMNTKRVVFATFTNSY